ncbi:SDR family NAD(P)-dependent oxidoreductase [Microbacterium sp. BK668]|uniref:SDR family NAD(P)-dependent oxidoreductase n=1 Tax=Microbacterium sp. BK668 TaxID=2512118 RepID=UPI001061EE3D|nr:SDR family NAD(P)-dependent oxidoreductase [Microbacterium sp. BK668]TDN90755.1 dehydrogenase/reductase SDR family protein X [Microbacterium sp. BK668]
MNTLTGRSAVVTGGTDGIGAATALELRARGAEVTIVGRSATKADAIVARAAALPGPGSLRAISADLSLMRTARDVGERLADELGHIDLLLNAVGILITRTAHTEEGIELDFAVGYLSRFVILETLAERGALRLEGRVITIAASGREVPKFARMEFHDLVAVEARTGMTSHGQAQLANDLLTAQAAARYGIIAIGYGPGAVDTSIRREVPDLIRAIMKPFYARRTRRPEDVGRQLADIFADPALQPGDTAFFDRDGRFPTPAFIADDQRQADLLRASLILADKALTPR